MGVMDKFLGSRRRRIDERPASQEKEKQVLEGKRERPAEMVADEANKSPKLKAVCQAIAEKHGGAMASGITTALLFAIGGIVDTKGESIGFSEDECLKRLELCSQDVEVVRFLHLLHLKLDGPPIGVVNAEKHALLFNPAALDPFKRMSGISDPEFQILKEAVRMFFGVADGRSVGIGKCETCGGSLTQPAGICKRCNTRATFLMGGYTIKCTACGYDLVGLGGPCRVCDDVETRYCLSCGHYTFAKRSCIYCGADIK